jgi:hypothetical protein
MKRLGAKSNSHLYNRRLKKEVILRVGLVGRSFFLVPVM